MSVNVLVPWVIAATILLFLAAYWLYVLEKRIKGMEARYDKFLSLADDLDHATVVDLMHRLEAYDLRLDQINAALKLVQAVVPHTIQGLGVVRYSAFPNVGGDQSFSLALVDEAGNGVVVSSLHGRNNTRVYAKPLTNWHTSYQLGAEEQDALSQARQMVETGA